MDRKFKKDDGDSPDEGEYPRADMCPDRTMSDYYCQICDSHMNSEQMWESHISGKRHIKNAKKDPSEMPGKVKSIKINQMAKLMELCQTVQEPLVGLNYVTEMQRADPDLKPAYTCHLCQAHCTWSVVIDHITSSKHRMRHLEVVDDHQFQIVKELGVSKGCLEQIIRNSARVHESTYGRGSPEVKQEKTQIVVPQKRIKTEETASGSKLGRYSPIRHIQVEETQSTSKHSRPLSIERRNSRYSPRRQSRSPEGRYSLGRRSRSPQPRRSRAYTDLYSRSRKGHSQLPNGKWLHDQYSPSPSPPPASSRKRRDFTYSPSPPSSRSRRDYLTDSPSPPSSQSRRDYLTDLPASPFSSSRRRRDFADSPSPPPPSSQSRRNFNQVLGKLKRLPPKQLMEYICDTVPNLTPSSDSECADLTEVYHALSVSMLMWEMDTLQTAHLASKAAKLVEKGNTNIFGQEIESLLGKTLAPASLLSGSQKRSTFSLRM